MKNVTYSKQSMKLHSTVIFVADIEKSKDFYTRLLECEIEHDFGKNVILTCGLCLWEIRPEHVICKELDVQTSASRFELYFETAQPGDAYNKLQETGVKFLHGIHEEPWGQRTMRFFDPDGHLVEIGDPLDVFVKNMAARGMTKKQIAEKSGIPEETVDNLLEGE